MSPHLARLLKLAAAWSLIAAAAASAGIFRASRTRDELWAQLARDARRSAVAFAPAEVQQLTGTAADRGTAGLAAIQQRLTSLAAVGPQVRRVYLLRIDASAREVTALADSVVGDTRAGESGMAHATGSPAWQELLRARRAMTAGPITDDEGTWASGFAVVGEGPLPAGEARNVLGLDVDASAWSGQILFAALQGTVFVFTLLGLPLGAWLVLKRQLEQREVIRNLSEAMEQSHSALLIIDLESRIEYANRGLCQQIGYGRRELIGRPWREFQAAEQATPELVDIITTVRAGRPWEGEWFNRRKDGTIYPVRGVITPVKHHDGSLSCFVAVFDDMTEIKRREAELRDARDLALAGDRAKSQFLATMSHEVRTPLNGIVGFTSLLLDTELAPEQREFVQTIRASGEALIQLTGDILDFARIESGKLKLDPLPCDPRECLEDALDLLAAKAAEKKIELLHSITPDVPAAIVTDSGRLRQVLVNLVGNAIKFTDRGEVEVMVGVALGGGTSAPTAGMCRLVFTVRDTGIGIPPELHDRLFKPFSQIDDSTTRRHGGTGLGLAISRNLVRLLGGEIQVKSATGHGSVFTFTVLAPVAAPPPPAVDLQGLPLALAAGAGPLRAQLAGLLRSWGAAVTEADAPPDLVGREWSLALVDVTDELTRALIAQPAPHPVLPPDRSFGLVPISLSSDSRHRLREHFRLLINKPVHHDALLALLSGSNPGQPAVELPATQFGFRVLVVEDNLVNQRLVQRVLENLGCTSAVVANGRQGLEELTRNAGSYDVVILDLHMPEMDGLTALQHIRQGRAGPRAQTMWVIALTADAREEQRVRARAAGINDYLTKPLNVTELETALRRFRTERTLVKR